MFIKKAYVLVQLINDYFNNTNVCWYLTLRFQDIFQIYFVYLKSEFIHLNKLFHLLLFRDG